MAVPALLLFDIDGTLLQRAADAHRDALLAAIAAVHQVADPGGVPLRTAGKTDLEIAREVLMARGVPEGRIAERASELRVRAAEEYARRCPADLRAHQVPGIATLLERLAARADVALSLVTGNLEPIARLKLARAGLARFFPRGQGGFGSDDEDRSALPAIARARAGTDGTPYPRDRTWVIGDTPRDIACARADGVRCLAVATGPYEAGALGGADGVAVDAGGLEALLLAELAPA